MECADYQECEQCHLAPNRKDPHPHHMFEDPGSCRLVLSPLFSFLFVLIIFLSFSSLTFRCSYIEDLIEISKRIFSHTSVAKLLQEALTSFRFRPALGERKDGTGPYEWVTFSELYTYLFSQLLTSRIC